MYDLAEIYLDPLNPGQPPEVASASLPPLVFPWTYYKIFACVRVSSLGERAV